MGPGRTSTVHGAHVGGDAVDGLNNSTQQEVPLTQMNPTNSDMEAEHTIHLSTPTAPSPQTTKNSATGDTINGRQPKNRPPLQRCCWVAANDGGRKDHHCSQSRLRDCHASRREEHRLCLSADDVSRMDSECERTRRVVRCNF